MSTPCPQCGNINIANAPQCLRCGAALSPGYAQPYQPQVVYVKKKRVWPYILLGIIVLGGIGVAISEHEKTKSAFSSESPSEPAISVSAADLISSYEANEVAADNSYKGKMLAVTGKIETIGKDLVNTSYVTLSSGKRYGIASVQCMFNREGGLGTLGKGQTVTLIGRCDGKLMNVLLKECVIKQ
jgi:tRNA_anti-like